MQEHIKLSITELPKTKKAEVDSANSIGKLQRNNFITEEEKKMNDIGMIYGSAVPMMLKRQLQFLAQPQRLPILRSSFMSLQSHMGKLNKLEFQDVMNKDNKLIKSNPHEIYLSRIM